MNKRNKTHQCMFCPHVFDSAATKENHILEHFTQEICMDCNQRLIRIGENLYTLHNESTCIRSGSKRTRKPKNSANSKSACKNQYEPEVIHEINEPSTFEEILIKVEPEDDNQQVQCENQNADQTDCIIIDSNHLAETNHLETNTIEVKQSKTVGTQTNDTTPIQVEKCTKDESKCDFCGQKFANDSSLKNHQKLRHRLNNNKENQSSESEANSNNDVRVTRSKKDKAYKRLECFICKKLYASLMSLRNHIDNMHDPTARKHMCQFCGIGFYRKYLLRNHLENRHLDMRKFVCSTCGMGLKTKNALERHMYRHSGVKPYKCRWNGCEKTFTLTANRDEHMRTHTGEKPFHCTIDGCDKRYTFAADIRKHKYKIHNVFPNKLPCKLCMEVFPQKAILMKHMMRKHNVL